MKTRAIVFAILILIGSVSAMACKNNGSQKKDLRVILIRHGEKPDDGDNLSCAGFNRSTKLPEVLKAKFGLPDYIYTPNPNGGKTTHNVRMLETVVPFAVKYNLNINTNYNVDQAAEVAANIQKRTGTVLVVWEHKQLEDIAAALGVSGSLKWYANDYDSIWIITYKHGKAILTQDKEGITPAAGCPF